MLTSGEEESQVQIGKGGIWGFWGENIGQLREEDHIREIEDNSVMNLNGKTLRMGDFIQSRKEGGRSNDFKIIEGGQISRSNQGVISSRLRKEATGAHGSEDLGLTYGSNSEKTKPSITGPTNYGLAVDKLEKDVRG